MNSRPSGANAMPVANGSPLATTSSMKPDGVKTMVASDRTGRPATAAGGRAAEPPPSAAGAPAGRGAPARSKHCSRYSSTNFPSRSDAAHPVGGRTLNRACVAHCKRSTFPGLGAQLPGSGSPFRRVPSPGKPRPCRSQPSRTAAKPVPRNPAPNGRRANAFMHDGALRPQRCQGPTGLPSPHRAAPAGEREVPPDQPAAAPTGLPCSGPAAGPRWSTR